MLWELVENAVVHDDDPHPTVALRARPVPDDRWHLALEVADDGPGIPDQERAVVLDGDETPLEHGSGLGLWLVRWRVTQLGGEVDIESDADGTVVTVRLPAEAGDVAADADMNVDVDEDETLSEADDPTPDPTVDADDGAAVDVGATPGSGSEAGHGAGRPDDSPRPQD